jgi:hypothetical protein
MYYGPPWAYPGDVNKLRINERCLKPPHIYRDFGGYFCEPPVIRVVVPGLMKAPSGFEAVVQPRAKHIVMLPIMTMPPIDFSSWTPPVHIFQFGVDIPYKRKPEVKHVQHEGPIQF